MVARVAIVTGGASGIGLATVERLAQEGATVNVFDINKSAGEQVCNQLIFSNTQRCTSCAVFLHWRYHTCSTKHWRKKILAI